MPKTEYPGENEKEKRISVFVTKIENEVLDHIYQI